MKTSELIPLTPQDWCRNPKGYVTHQRFLKLFVEYLEEHGVVSVLPPDRKSWDRGVDLHIQGLGNIDSKGFSLIEGPKSFTWESSFWSGRKRPLYNESLTDFFVHPLGNSVADWIIAPASSLTTSYFGDAPFYWKDRCQTVKQAIDHIIDNV